MKSVLIFFLMMTMALIAVTAIDKIAQMDVQARAQARATEDLLSDMMKVKEQQQFLLAAFCNETNLRSKKPQELSMDQCMDYARITKEALSGIPTPTALERDTTRRGLGKPDPTPCSGELPCGAKK